VDWHSDSLRAGRFGVLTPAGVIFSPPVQTGSGACRASCTAGTGTFSQGQSRRGVDLTILPYLPSSLTKGYNYTPTPPLCIHGMLQSKIRRLPTSSAFCCTKEWELILLLQPSCVNRASFVMQIFFFLRKILCTFWTASRPALCDRGIPVQQSLHLNCWSAIQNAHSSPALERHTTRRVRTEPLQRASLPH